MHGTDAEQMECHTGTGNQVKVNFLSLELYWLLLATVRGSEMKQTEAYKAKSEAIKAHRSSEGEQ